MTGLRFLRKIERGMKAMFVGVSIERKIYNFMQVWLPYVLLMFQKEKSFLTPLGNRQNIKHLKSPASFKNPSVIPHPNPPQQ